jgi:hypothetical protein
LPHKAYPNLQLFVSQSPDAKLLTAWITNSSKVGKLPQLVYQHGSSMDFIHLAAAVNRLGIWQRDDLISGSQQQTQVHQLVADIEQLLVQVS